MRKLSGLAILALFLLTILACNLTTTNNSGTATLPAVTPTNKPDLAPTLSPLQIDLTYCTTADGVKLTMDLYRPKQMSGPAPAVLYVHGGGWTGGDKSDGAGLFFKEELVQRGYVMAAINYRLAPKYVFPAQIEDVKCAVRYLRANAAKYNLDPQHIGAIGGSAGGQLVSLLGVSDKEWNTGENSDQSSRVQAVVDMFGPSDLQAIFAGRGDRLALEVFNISGPDDPALQKYSPVTYVTPDDPPFLILQGDQDQLVPLEQSQILYDKLKAAGVPVELVVVKNAGHGFVPVGGDIQPSIPELVQIVANFFEKYLK